MVSKKQLEEDMIDVFDELYALDSVNHHNSRSIERLADITSMQSAQINAIMGYMGVNVIQVTNPQTTEYKVVKKGKK